MGILRFLNSSSLGDTVFADFSVVGTSFNAFSVKQTDGTVILNVDTGDPGDPSRAVAPDMFNLEINGDVGFAGSGNQIRCAKLRATIGSGTQSGRFRGMDALLKYEGSASHSGTGGNEIRVWNGSTAWNSTGTCSSMLGMQNYIACGGGSGVTTGLVTDAVANRALIGFNSNDGGSYTNGTGFLVGAPNNVDANHTIAKMVAFEAEDMEATGVAEAFSILTGTGRAQIGQNGKASGKIIDSSTETTTTDATPTSAARIVLDDENTYIVKAYVSGVKDDGTDRASYEVIATVYRTGAGTATLQGGVTVVHSQESNAAWDATLVVSGNDIQVQVTGVAGTTIVWGTVMQAVHVSS